MLDVCTRSDPAYILAIVKFLLYISVNWVPIQGIIISKLVS